MHTTVFGEQLRRWRRLRGVSQLDLSLRAHVSSRHISFLETGRSRPSREMVVQLCESLDVPLRVRNELLRMAGFAPLYPENDLAGEALEPFRQIVAQLLRNHEPFPAFVLDRYWNIVDANLPARLMAPEVAAGRANTIELIWGPGGWRERIENLPEVAQNFLARLEREVEDSGGDERLAALLRRTRELLSDVPLRPNCDEAEIVVCPRLRVGDRVIRTVSAVARFGTARDVTLSELRVEFLCPADKASADFFRALASAGG